MNHPMPQERIYHKGEILAPDYVSTEYRVINNAKGMNEEMPYAFTDSEINDVLKKYTTELTSKPIN